MCYIYLTHAFAYRVHFMIRRCLRSPRQVYFAKLTFWPHQEALSKSLSSGNIKIKIKVWGVLERRLLPSYLS